MQGSLVWLGCARLRTCNKFVSMCTAVVLVDLLTVGNLYNIIVYMYMHMAGPSLVLVSRPFPIFFFNVACSIKKKIVNYLGDRP